jgi:hypothetical protein
VGLAGVLRALAAAGGLRLYDSASGPLLATGLVALGLLIAGDFALRGALGARAM